MRLITYLATLLLAVFLAACGGGGGAPGLPSGTPKPITTSAPAALTVAVGSTQSYTIVGGRAPYQIASSNVQVAVGGLDASNFSIAGVATGAATITISDSAQQTSTIAVTVGNLVALYTTAPATMTIAVNTNRLFSVGGGVAPYKVSSEDIRVASATLSGSVLTISGIAAGNTNLAISDATGVSTLKLTVTVGGSSPVGLYTTAPQLLTIVKDTSRSFEIGGGVAPYTVVSTDERIAAVVKTTTGMTIIGVAGGSTSIVVRDAAGATLGIGVTVGGTSPAPMFTNAPSSLYVANGATRTFTITGGVAAYSAQSTDPSVVTASVSGSTLTIQAMGGGSSTVEVVDSIDTKLTIQVTVGSSTALFINAPDSVTLAAGSNATYVVGGGTAPYNASSSSTRVATASIAGTALTVSGVSSSNGDTANIVVVDSVGARKTLAVTVNSNSPVLSQDPVLKSAVLKDASGTVTNSIGTSGYSTLSVKLTDPSGTGLASQVITVTGDVNQVVFPEGGSGLTDPSGMASIKVARASLTATGAGALTVTYSYKAGTFTTYPDGSTPPATDKVLSTYVGYQLATTNISLTSLNVGAATLAAYGTRQISVQVNINGAVATTTSIPVNFTASCGQIAPTTISSNSSGIATVSYTANETSSPTGCSGKTVEISASATGAAVVTKSLTITAAAATSINFVTATPSRIYLANSGGATQAIVSFKLVDSQGTGLPSQDIVLTLKTLNGGIPKASLGTVGNVSPITVTTDSTGAVSVPVFSGTVPTSVLVNAALKSTPAINADSAILAIASGRAAQNRVSLSIEKLSIEGFSVDGTTTNVTMSLADRQGNPVPDGTAVNFTTSGGVMIPPVCYTGGLKDPVTGVYSQAGNSQCTVTIRSQNPRLVPPASSQLGRVAILAYASGEEDFVDNNFNNVYDVGDTFTDLGNAFRDDNENGYTAGEFSVPRNGSVSIGNGCPGENGRPTTCDGVWGSADVRKQGIIIFATGGAIISLDSLNTSGIVYTVSDLNGNSLPTGTKITVAAIDNTPTNTKTCAVLVGGSAVIPNTLLPSQFGAGFGGCDPGDSVGITVTSPLGLVTTKIFGF